MQHVDEGILHAYVDGELGDSAVRREVEEHVNGCAACASALEEARGVRDRAAGILRVDVALDVPPFESVVKRRSGGSRRRLRRLRVIGLAATLAVAAGVTWYARDGWRAGTEYPAAASPATAEPRDGTADATETGLASEAAPPATPGPTAGGGGANARRQEADRIELADAPPAAAPARAEAEERVAEPVPAAAGDQVAVSPVPADKVADENAARDSLAAAGDRQRLALDARAVSGVAAARSFAVEAARVPGWTTVDEDSAAAHLGRSPARVPELPVVAYGVRTNDPAGSVRVIQALDDGTLLELIERGIPDDAVGRMLRRPDLDAGVASFLPDSVARVRIELEGYEIIGRANLPAESLRVLMGRVR